MHSITAHSLVPSIDTSQSLGRPSMVCHGPDKAESFQILQDAPWPECLWPSNDPYGKREHMVWKIWI